MKAILYVGPGSHPSMTARLMLAHKDIPHRRRDLIFVISKLWLRAAGFPGVTLPALKVDGKRVQGSREIARELDRIKLEPPLFPADADARAAVEEAERWGDEVFQSRPRRILWWCLKRDGSPMRSYLEGSRVGVPHGLATTTGAPIVWLSARFNKSTDDNVRADLATLPDDLDRIDGWIADGVLGGEQPNAADFQIATSLRLLMTLDDLRPALDGRPAGELAMRIAADFPGRVPAGALPAEWTQRLRAGAPA